MRSLSSPTRTLALIALGTLLTVSTARAGDPDPEEPPPDEFGYSLLEEWDQAWRRIADRSGRPDPTGPVQQRFERVYPRYELDLAIPDFPMSLERAWAERIHGARLWVFSLNEFDLANQVQLKTRAELGRGWHLGLRFDRLQTRTAQSDLFRLEFEYAPCGAAGPFFSFAVYPRWEKIDTDLVAAAGYRHPRWGEARLRLFGLDPATNASYALAGSREADLPERAHQDDLPLAAAAELATRSHRVIRAEAYLGGILPHGTTRSFEDPSRDHVQDLSGLLAGGLVEWRVPRQSLWLGATGMALATDWERAHDSEPALDHRVEERTYRLRAYALAAPIERVQVEGQVRWTARPELDTWPGAPEMSTSRRDREWLFSARGWWFISRHAGIDLALMRTQRDTSGPPDVSVDGTNHRLVTRAILRLGRLWASFGVGWDLDPVGKGPYGGGGATFIVDL